MFLPVKITMQRFFSQGCGFKMCSFFGEEDILMISGGNQEYFAFQKATCSKCPKRTDEGCSAEIGQLCQHGEHVAFKDVNVPHQNFFRRSVYFSNELIDNLK